MQLVDIAQVLFLLLWGAWGLKKIIKNEWWRLPTRDSAPVPFWLCLTLFLIYIPVQALIVLAYQLSTSDLKLLAPVTIIVTFIFYILVTSLPILRPIWKRPAGFSFLESVKTGALTLLAVAPLVFLFEGALILFFEYFLGFARLDQDAILYLQSLRDSPYLFAVVAVLIATVVPLLEELLFRGLLQNALTTYLSPKVALPLTAAVFTLFHYSNGQGISNAIILPSLFILALTLSWIYERTGNLWAPITLHSLFNTFSVISLVFQ